MAQAYSLDLRKKVMNAVQKGSSARAAAKRFDISPTAAIRWMKRWRETGVLEPRKRGHGKQPILDRHDAFLLALITAKADMTLEEMREKLRQDCGIKVAVSTIWLFFNRRGITFKKKTGHAEEQQRPDVLARRSDWISDAQQFDLKRVVFLDETGLSTKMARLRGRSPRGERCRAPLPCGSWRTTTFIGAMRLDGMVAPGMTDGPVNGDVFLLYVKGFLAPALRPNDIVIMDNLSTHKIKGAREAIEAVGAQLRFLPPYSPDFNPIENIFAKLKALLRNAAARTTEELDEAVKEVLKAITAEDCANCFAAAGYVNRN